MFHCEGIVWQFLNNKGIQKWNVAVHMTMSKTSRILNTGLPVHVSLRQWFRRAFRLLKEENTTNKATENKKRRLPDTVRMLTRRAG